MDWYEEMRKRVEAGEDPLDLTIEKYGKIVNFELHMGHGFNQCPLCVKYHSWGGNPENGDCDDCPVYKAGQGCLDKYDEDGEPVLFEQLMDLDIALDNAWEAGAAVEARRKLMDFIKETIIPGLRQLKANTPGGS